MRFCLAAASAGVYVTLYISREYFINDRTFIQMSSWSQLQCWYGNIGLMFAMTNLSEEYFHKYLFFIKSQMTSLQLEVKYSVALALAC